MQERSAKVRNMPQQVRVFACACDQFVRVIVGADYGPSSTRSESRSDADWYPIRMIDRQAALWDGAVDDRQ